MPTTDEKLLSVLCYLLGKREQRNPFFGSCHGCIRSKRQEDSNLYKITLHFDYFGRKIVVSDTIEGRSVHTLGELQDFLWSLWEQVKKLEPDA